MIRGFMPLGVAQFPSSEPIHNSQFVIRGFMPLGVAQCLARKYMLGSIGGDSWLYAVRRCSVDQAVWVCVAQTRDSWLYAVRRCSVPKSDKRFIILAVIRGFMPLGVAQSYARVISEWIYNVIRGFMPLGVAQCSGASSRTHLNM